MRNENFESYLIDIEWKNPLFTNYKILAIPLKDNQYYYTISGLLVDTLSLKPSDKKAIGLKPIVLFESKNYEMVKYYFLKMILNNLVSISNENISDEKDFIVIRDIFNKINN